MKTTMTVISMTKTKVDYRCINNAYFSKVYEVYVTTLNIKYYKKNQPVKHQRRGKEVNRRPERRFFFQLLSVFWLFFFFGVLAHHRMLRPCATQRMSQLRN